MRRITLIPVAVLLGVCGCGGPTGEAQANGSVTGPGAEDSRPIDFSDTSDASYPVPLSADPGTNFVLADMDDAPIPVVRQPMADDYGQLVIPGPALAQLKARYPSFIAYCVIQGRTRKFQVNLVSGDLVVDLAVPNRAPSIAGLGGDAIAKEGASAAGRVVASDPDGDALSYRVVTEPAHGTFAMAADGSWTWTAPVGWTGIDSVTLGVSDGGLESTAAFPVISEINRDVNHAPYSVSPLKFRVNPLSSYSANTGWGMGDADGDPLAFAGAVSLAGTKIDSPPFYAGKFFSYASEGFQSGVRTSTYDVSDPHGAKGTQTLTLDYRPAYFVPIRVQNGAPVTFSLSSLGLPVDGADVVKVFAPDLSAPQPYSANGVLSDNGDGTLTFSPAPNPSSAPRVSSFSCSVNYSDGFTGTVAVVVYENCHEPAPAPLAVSIDEDGRFAGSLAVQGPAMMAYSYHLAAQARNGTASVGADGSCSYAPNARFHGQDSFSYYVRDWFGGAAIQTVTVTVRHVNHPPTISPGAIVRVPSGERASGTLSAQDVDGDRLTFARVPPGMVRNLEYDGFGLSPDGSWTYEALAPIGAKAFDVYAIDPSGAYAKGSLRFEIMRPNHAPETSDGEARVADGGVLEGVVSATDADGDPLTYALASGPAHGSAVVAATGEFTYVPTPGYSGGDSFSFTASDGYGGSRTGTVAVAVARADAVPGPDTVFSSDPTGVSVHKQGDDDLEAAEARAARLANDLAAATDAKADADAAKSGADAAVAVAETNLDATQAQIDKRVAASIELAAADLTSDDVAAQIAAGVVAKYGIPAPGGVTTTPGDEGGDISDGGGGSTGGTGGGGSSGGNSAGADGSGGADIISGGGYGGLALASPAAGAPDPETAQINTVGKAKVEAKVAQLRQTISALDGQIAEKVGEVNRHEETYRRKSQEARDAYAEYLDEKARFDGARSAYQSARARYVPQAALLPGPAPGLPDVASAPAATYDWLSLYSRCDDAASALETSRAQYNQAWTNYPVPAPTMPVRVQDMYAPGLSGSYAPGDRTYCGMEIKVGVRMSQAAGQDYPFTMQEVIRKPDGSFDYGHSSAQANNRDDYVAVGDALSLRGTKRAAEIAYALARGHASDMASSALDMFISRLFEDVFQNYQTALTAANDALAAKSQADEARIRLTSLRAAKAKAEADLAAIDDFLAQHGWYLDQRGTITDDLAAKRADADTKAAEAAQAEAAVAVIAADKASADALVADLRARLPDAPIDRISATVSIGGRDFILSVPVVAGSTLAQAQAQLDQAVASAKANTAVSQLALPGQAQDKSAWTYVWRDPKGDGAVYAYAWGYGTCWDQSVATEAAACGDAGAVSAASAALAAKMAAIDVSWTAEPLASGGGIRFLTRPVIDGAAWPKIVEARFAAGVGGIEIPLWADGAASYEDAATASRAGTPGAPTVQGLKDALRAKAAAFRKSAGVAYAGATYDVYSDGRAWWARYRLPNAGTGAWSYVQPRADRASCEAAVKAAVDAAATTEGVPNAGDARGILAAKAIEARVLGQLYQSYVDEHAAANALLTGQGSTSVPTGAATQFRPLSADQFSAVLGGSDAVRLEDHGLRKSSNGIIEAFVSGRTAVIHGLDIGLSGIMGADKGAVDSVADTLAMLGDPWDTAEQAVKTLDGISDFLVTLSVHDAAKAIVTKYPESAYWQGVYGRAKAKYDAFGEDFKDAMAAVQIVWSDPDKYLQLVPTFGIPEFWGLDRTAFRHGYVGGYIAGQFLQAKAAIRIGKVSASGLVAFADSRLVAAVAADARAMLRSGAAAVVAERVAFQQGWAKLVALLRNEGWPGMRLSYADGFYEGVDELVDAGGEYRSVGRVEMRMEPFRREAIGRLRGGEVSPEFVTRASAMGRWRAMADSLSDAGFVQLLRFFEAGAYAAVTESQVAKLRANKGKSAVGYLVGVLDGRIKDDGPFTKVLLDKLSRGEVETVQLHHFLTDKFSGNANYTRQFLERLSEAFPSRTWNLDEPWNLEWVVNHQGRHTERYSEIMLDRLNEIIAKTKPDASAFFREFEALKLKVAKDPVGYGLINE